MVPFIIQGDNIVVFSGGQPTTVDKTHINYTKLLEALKASDWDAIPGLLTVKKAITTMCSGDVTFDGETLMYKGKVMEGALATRLIKMFKENFPITHLMNFINRLNKNPSYRAIQELYGFLEANSLPITDDGCFLAYKRVRHDYLDCHSGTMDNSVGAVVEMPRNEVDDNRDNTCSRGLHFCGYSYLSSFGGDRIVVLKIDPADVVSIPSDYNNQKGRACRYTVISEIAVLEDAVEKDVLGNGPAVVMQSNVSRKRSVEDIFWNSLLDDDIRDLVFHLEELYGEEYHGVGVSAPRKEMLKDLLADFTYSQIRYVMQKLGFSS